MLKDVLNENEKICLIPKYKSALVNIANVLVTKNIS